MSVMIGDNGSFEQNYINLRTVLDGLQITSLRFCLDDKDPEVRSKRAKEIEELVKPVIEELSRRLGADPGNDGCGDGFRRCHDICVPYPCPS